MKKLLFILSIFTLISCDKGMSLDCVVRFDNTYKVNYRLNGCGVDAATIIEVSEGEFNRLKNLLNNSTEDCVGVTIHPIDGSDFIEGYLKNNTNTLECALSK